MTNNESNLWLVAEDSEDDFFLLQRACSRLIPPPTLQRAKNGVEAQEYLRGQGAFNIREMPSVIVSDLNMPVMGGLDLVAWFKTHEWAEKIRFVLLTSSNDQSDRNRASKAGVDEYLVKPGTFEELVTTVGGISERALSSAYLPF